MTEPIDEARVLVVPDFSRFGSAARAGVDDAMRDLSADVRATMTQIDRTAATTGAAVGESFQRGGERAESAFDELSGTARRNFTAISASAATTSLATTGAFTTAMGLIGAAVAGMAIAAGAGLAALGVFGLKAASDIEQTTIGLKSLVGSGEAATEFLKEIQQFAASTTFEFAGVADSARRVLAFGEAVGITRQEVIPTIKVIGDLVSVLGGGQYQMESVIRALGQISSKGKVSQEELLQLAEALPGFSANAAIASSLGLTTAETLEKITRGEIDARTGIDALILGMANFRGAAGAMQAQSETLAGVLSNFKDTAVIALSDAFTPVIPLIKDSLKDLTPVVGEAVGDLAPALGGAMATILPALGGALKAIVPVLTPILNAIGPVLEQLGPALAPLGPVLGELFTALAPVLPLLAAFIGAVAQLAIPVLMVLTQVLLALTPVINFMTRAIAEFSKALGMIDWREVGHAIADFASTSWEETKKLFSAIGDFFKSLPGMARDQVELAKQFIIAKFNEAVDFARSIPGRIYAAFKETNSQLIQAGKDTVYGIWEGIQSLGGWLWTKVKTFVMDNTVNAAKQALGISSPSRVFADEVGEMIPAGIEQGVKAGAAGLAGLLSFAGPGPGVAPALAGMGMAGDGAAAAGFGPIIINITFAGVVPTEAEARRTGQQAGAGVADGLARRNVSSAVRKV